MDRPFLDANILFSVAYKPGTALAALWTLADTELLTAPCAVVEACRNLLRVRPQQLPELARLLAGVVLVADPPIGATLPAGVQLPDKDKPVFLAAMSAQATHLLTGDAKHFGPYFGQTIGGVLILRPAVYLRGRQSTP